MPGFFGDQTNRLVRENWGHPAVNLLAEELAAMFGAERPMTTDQPIIITRNNAGGPAITIIDNTDGSTPPIDVKGGSPGTEVIRPGDYKCCGGTGGGSSGGGKPGDKSDDPPPLPDPGSGGGNVSPNPEPPAPPSKRMFQGNLRIEIDEPDNPFGWDGQRPVFVGSECRLYNPPTIPAPSSALSFAEVNAKLIAFFALHGLSGSYHVIDDVVTGPGVVCTG